MGGCLSCKTEDRRHVHSVREVHVRTVPPAQSNYDFYGSQFKEEDRYDPYPAYEIRPTPAPANVPKPAPVPTVSSWRSNCVPSSQFKPRPGALYGEYKCGCGYFWVSRLSWRDKYQQCKRCRAQVRPRNQRELRPTDFKRGDTQGLQHPEELCEMCKRVGGYCGKYK